MTRRVIVTSQKILKARMKNWEYHFDLHRQALSFPPQTLDRVLAACTRMPEPKVTLTGGLNEWEYYASPLEKRIDIFRSSGLGLVHTELLVKWYWTETLWQTLYVDAFNALPHPHPTYKMQFVDGYPQLISVSTPTVRENWLITASEMKKDSEKSRVKR